jgi:lysophospholipase L1-like esterase
MMTRRKLLGTGAATMAATTLTRPTNGADSAVADPGTPKLAKGDVILFQGDSITDVGRDRKNQSANRGPSFGNGYPMLIACDLLRDHAESQLKIFNRGISGNKVPDLDRRWDQDCLDLKPALLSILIGVNDIWHKLNGRYDGTVESYRDGLAALLERTRAGLPDIDIVICEPFVLRCGAVTDKWFPEFEQRRQACLEVAEGAGCTIVQFQKMFDDALDVAPPNYWAGDGVHPTMAGHALMAKTWRDTVGI